ncbi:Flp family type IVb pilin [Kineosporia succinea]|uniref:Flp pilus assembly pilin Flp n=1 Tax=Kineosporia succinea TaxID=84632 RepID=A0ABT9P0U8_9ACTN|nr:hypothetical protein [Kineosporia succinea]MDP9826302.1 Flp pilus assembly pilin Flp [Kineosporia succinea]
MTRRAHPDRGASAVEYGLLAGGVVFAFLIAFIGMQTLVGEVFGRAVTSVEQTPQSGPAGGAGSSVLRGTPAPRST